MNFFAVLPDTPAAGHLVPRLAGGPDVRTIAYPSGNPWLVGRWPDARITTVTGTGGRHLVILGTGRIDTRVAEHALNAAGSLHDLDRLARRLTGSFHLCATIDGRTRVQGSVCTARQVMHATVSGVTIAADSPDPLLALTGGRIDEDTLALRLLTPGVPWPLSQRSVWAGVTEVPAGCWLELGPAGARTVRWWEAPPPEAPLAVTRDALRDALIESVAVRARGRDTMSADLSGGMDSTTLCFLAARTDARLVTSHWRPLDQANDDSEWARRAAGLLPGVVHREVAADEGPTWFESLPAGTDDGAAGPLLWDRNRARMDHISRAVAGLGSDLHLCGVGGDELFSPLPAFLWSLTRAHPLRTVGVVRRWRAVNRWRLGPLLRGLADRTTFAASLARDADLLTAPLPGPGHVNMGWSARPRMPLWATPDAVAAARRLLREAAEQMPPLDPDRVQHLVLESAVLSGTAIRQMNAVLAPSGVTWEMPFLDDRVLEAALSVRIADRFARDRYKPVLAEAVRGIVPEPVLGRRSKGEYSAEVYDGMRRNQHDLLAYCDDLRLGERGLADPVALRSALVGPKPESRHLAPFENTLACEAWLRRVTSTAGKEIPV